jgi:hypothetical protein
MILVLLLSPASASPHISGLSLLLMAREGKQLSADDLIQRIAGLGLQGIVRGVVANTKNVLAFNGI